MKLRKWMEANGLDVYEASKAFDVSIYAVKKWLKEERIPRSKMQSKIKKVTKGAVSGDDWMLKD